MLNISNANLPIYVTYFSFKNIVRVKALEDSQDIVRSYKIEQMIYITKVMTHKFKYTIFSAHFQVPDYLFSALSIFNSV